MNDTPDVPAHDQYETIYFHRHYEAHHQRKGDPYYHLFEEAKARLKKLGLWKCVIATADCNGQIQCHHDLIEFAYQNSIDLDMINKLLGLHLDDEGFRKFIEGPGNLEPLCLAHHQGRVAIHKIPAADWTTVRVHKDALIPIEVMTKPQKSLLTWARKRGASKLPSLPKLLRRLREQL